MMKVHIKKFVHMSILSLCCMQYLYGITEQPMLSQEEMFQSYKQKEIDAPMPEEQHQKLHRASNNQKIHREKHLQIKPEELRPKSAVITEDKKVEINLNNTDVLNMLKWIEEIFNVSFITGDIIVPSGPGKVAGNTISFKTIVPLSKTAVWDLFLSFLDLFNLTIVPIKYVDEYPQTFQIAPAPDANKMPIPSFVGINWQDLPDNDTKIRYVYFIENSTLDALYGIVDQFRSKNSALAKFDPLKALIITDKASNIKSLMAIITELDTVTMPEAMSVLKLKRADAEDVKKLYDQLVSTEAQGGPVARLFGTKKASTAVYFPENTRLIAEKRTNSLIVLGTKEGIEKVEQFIVNHVDTELQIPYSPLYVYELQYANAKDIADVLTEVTAFGPGSTAAAFGGIRDGDKYFQPMKFIPEISGNRLLIKAVKEDYLKVRDIIKALDVKQPQIAIEVLIVNITALNQKELGTQLRNKRPETIGENVNFQTSGITNPGGGPTGIIVNKDTGSIMSNLISLAQGQSPGTTLISLGSNFVGGVWALFKALEHHAHTNVVAHPFLVATNKYPSTVLLGQSRYVQTGIVTGGGASSGTFQPVNADLKVQITPQINNNGIITLNIAISIDSFTDADNQLNANTNTKTIKTSANIANKEILAIGGLLQTTASDTISQVPLLGNIPLIGWFFKDKTQERDQSNLLVFISPQIVEPRLKGGINLYTEKKSDFSKQTLAEMHNPSEIRDPIHRWFFNDNKATYIDSVDDFVTRKYQAERLDIGTSEYYCNKSTIVDDSPTNLCRIPSPNAIASVAVPERGIKRAPEAPKRAPSVSELIASDQSDQEEVSA